MKSASIIKVCLLLLLSINIFYTNAIIVDHINTNRSNVTSIHDSHSTIQSFNRSNLVRGETTSYDPKSSNTIFNTNTVNNVLISANITSNQILKSNYTIQLNFSQIVQEISYRLSAFATYTNITGSFLTYPVVLPDFKQSTEISMSLDVKVYNSNMVSLANATIYFNLDDDWVFVSYIPPQSKLLPNTQLNISYDLQPLGINWRWDLNNVVTNAYSSDPIITTPSADGSYTLVLVITNPSGVEQPALNYNYYIDGTAPPLNPITDISVPLSAGITIVFQNTTTLDNDQRFFNFTFVGSGVYTTTFPKVPVPSGTYILWASVKDELGNTNTANYTIHAKIGIVNLYPDQAGRPGIPMNISLSETPSYQNYTFYFLNNTIYSSSFSPNVSLLVYVGSYVFKVYLNDVHGNWLNVSYNILVDNTPVTYISCTPGNNSILYSSTTITLTFDEVPYQIIYNFNSGVNMTSQPITLPNAAGIYHLTVYASDLALNWMSVNLTFTRFYRPVLLPGNNSIVMNNFTVTANINFPVNMTYIHWDGNSANQTFADYNTTSGLRTLNLTLVYNNIVSSNIYCYIINVTVLAINTPYRVQSNVPINPTFSEDNVKFSWKWNSALTWKFTQMVTASTQGLNTLTIQMYSADLKYSFEQQFTFYIDNTPPQILSISPFTTASNFTTLRSGNSVSISFTDQACSGYCFSSIQYHFDSQPMTTINLTTYQATIQQMSLGTIPVDPTGYIANISVSITDIAQNDQVVTYSYIIDNTAPKLLASNVNNNSVIPIPWDLQLNFSGNTILQANFTFSKNGNSNSTTDFYFGNDITIPNFIFGNNSVNLACNVSDHYGNSRLLDFHFTTSDPALILTTNQTIPNLRASDKLFFFENKPVVNGNVTYSIGNSSITYHYLNTTVPLFKNYEGYMNITISALDYQGVVTTIKYTTIVDTKAPSCVVSAIQIANDNKSILAGPIPNDTWTRILNPSLVNISITDLHATQTNVTLVDETGFGEYYSFNASFYSIPMFNDSFSHLYLDINTKDSYGNFYIYHYLLVSVNSTTTTQVTQVNSLVPEFISFGFIGIVIVAALLFGANKKFDLLSKYNVLDTIKKIRIVNCMKKIFLFILILISISCLHHPTATLTSKPNSNPTLYKFNATTDTASSLQLNDIYPLTKGKGMLIAEIDTGISSMFESHIFHNPNETIDGKDDDHNGYIDDVRGWNVLSDNNNTFDNSITYHGTEVASVILNISPEATILPIKYIGSDNSISSYSNLLLLNNALDYASLFRPDIIVMAFNFNIVTPSSILTRLQNLQNNGTIILVAAGNCDPTQNNCGYIQSPARNNYVYAIGSIAFDNSHSPFSAEGSQLDFVLYGQGVMTYSPDYPSGNLDSGTSFSVAMAGGLFALYKDLFLQAYSSFNLTNFMKSILLTSKNLGDHNLYGNGIPQAYTAYKALYDTDYPQLTSYTYSQASPNIIILNTAITEQSGIENCTYQQANQNADFGSNQTCYGVTLLPSISNSFDQAYYSFYVDNVSTFLN